MSQVRDEDLTVIVGCGRLGAFLAESLSDAGHGVLVIDLRQEAFRKLPPNFGGLAMAGDAADLSVLREAQLDEAGALVAVTDSDNLNIMVAQIAKDIFGIPRIIARLYDPERSSICEDSGIKTVCPSELSARKIEHLLTGK